MLLSHVDPDTVKTIIDSISDGIQIYNADGYLVYCNEKCEMLDDILGKSSIGKHVTSIYPPFRGGESTIVKVLRTGKPVYDLEQDYINYRGRRLAAVTTTLPLMYAGKLVGAIEITRSLTENRELNEKIKQLRSEAEAFRISGDIGLILGKKGETSSASFSDTDEDFELDMEQVMSTFEKKMIENMMERCHYNLTECARRLSLPRQTLQYKVKKYGISRRTNPS